MKKILFLLSLFFIHHAAATNLKIINETGKKQHCAIYKIHKLDFGTNDLTRVKLKRIGKTGGTITYYPEKTGYEYYLQYAEKKENVPQEMGVQIMHPDELAAFQKQRLSGKYELIID